MKLDKVKARAIVRAAIDEDIGSGDITTRSLIDKSSIVKAVIVSREDCIVCGVEIAGMVMAEIDCNVSVKPGCRDGMSINSGMNVISMKGSAASILSAERTMLNFLTLLSGIATRTRQYCDKVKPYDVKIMDTRKTIPLLRYLEKYAVSTGGGTNHRMGLYDQTLIKDNHIYCRKAASYLRGNYSLKSIVEEARMKSPKGSKVEIEVSGIEEFNDAILGRPDIIMLDNMSVNQIGRCLKTRNHSTIKPLLEVSGGVTLDTVRKYAKTGVDMISIGELTDSVKAVDMSLDFI